MSLFFVGEGRVSPPASGVSQPLPTRPRAVREVMDGRDKPGHDD